MAEIKAGREQAGGGVANKKNDIFTCGFSVSEISLGEAEVEEGVIISAGEELPEWVEERLGKEEEEGIKRKGRKREKVENIKAPDTRLGTVVAINTVLDERDGIRPTEGKGGKGRGRRTRNGWPVRYIEKTRWIVPGDAKKEIVFPDEEVIKEYIYDCSGILSEILERMNWHAVSKGELMRWIAKYGLENDVTMARDGLIDKAEGVVDRALNIDDLDTAKFVLKTAGKKRGWNERTEDNNEMGKNVYQLIHIASGGKGDLEKMEERDLVKYLEDMING